MATFNRIILMVLDSVGIGEMPDAAAYGDAGSNTLGNPLAGVPARERPEGCFGKAAIGSAGKDTTTGHWEMAGLLTRVAFPTYPNGFPPRVVEPFERAVGRRVL